MTGINNESFALNKHLALGGLTANANSEIEGRLAGAICRSLTTGTIAVATEWKSKLG